jgi:hypothetical protein
VERLGSGQAEVTLTADALEGDWFGLILRRGRQPTAFSNAIYVRSLPEP